MARFAAANPKEAGRGSDDALFTRHFGFLIVAHLLQGMGYASMLLLPLYLAFLDANNAQIGLIIASASISGLLFRPVVGWALDTIGRRPTVTVGTILLAIGMAMVFFVRDTGPMAYVMRCVFGIGMGATFTGYFAFAADIIPSGRRTEGLAIFGASGLVPLALNPLVGKIGVEPSQLIWMYPILALVVLLSIPAIWSVPEVRKHEQLGQPFSLRDAFHSLTKRPLLPVWVATFAFSALVAVFMAFSTVCAERRGLMEPANLWFTYGLGAISVRLFGGRLPDRIGTHNMVTPALSCCALSAVLIASAWTDGEFLLAGLLAGIGHGYCFPVLMAQVVTRSPERLRGTAVATFTALWGVASLLVAPVFGLIADRFGDATMFSSGAVAALIALGIWAVLEHQWGAGASGVRPVVRQRQTGSELTA